MENKETMEMYCGQPISIPYDLLFRDQPGHAHSTTWTGTRRGTGGQQGQGRRRTEGTRTTQTTGTKGTEGAAYVPKATLHNPIWEVAANGPSVAHSPLCVV